MKLQADIGCPSCGRKFKQAIDGMRPGATRRCPNCLVTIKFTGDDGRVVQRAVDDLERKLKDISRRFGR